MTKLALFTDLHYDVTPRPEAPNAKASLERGLAHVQAHGGDPDLVIFCGDLAHRGETGAYEELKQSLEALALPYVLMIGNHDNRENFLSVFPDTPLDENGFVQRVIDFPEVRLVLLDTLFAPPYDYPRTHAGYLCEKRLAWLEARLGESDRPCIIAMHHPPHSTGFAAMDTLQLINGNDFYEVVERVGNVRHLLLGHVHRTIHGTYRGLPYSVFKSPVGQMPMLFDVMDFHMETHEPPAYGLIHITKDAVQVHTEDYGLTDLAAAREAAKPWTLP